MTERLGELRPLFVMALKAEVRLSDREEMFRCPRGMDAVAANAAHITPAVGRALKDRVLACVALQATIVYLSGRGFCRVEDL